MELRLARNRDFEDRLLVVGRFEDRGLDLDLPDGELTAAAKEVEARGSGRKGELVETTYGRRGRLRAIGLGRSEDATRQGLTRWIASTVASIQKEGVERLVLAVPRHPETEGAAGAARVVQAVVQGGYRFDAYRQEKGSPAPGLSHFALVPPRGQEAAYRRALPAARTVAEATRWARDLGNSPPNVATPAWLASQARRMARAKGLRATILGPNELKKRGMGGVLAVGGGSAHPPRMVRLRWGDRGPKVALVGKGVTFDTGGISIKPSASMEEMKYDKCGACAVLAIARAVAELELPLRLTAYAAFAENMPDGASYRPSDIVRCYDGSTVEIVNTDAEGRMLLADALAWARRDEPDTIVDFATLTGACVVALGEGAAGLFTHDDALATELLASAEAAAERLWRLPLWPEYGEEMKGEHADLKNSGGRWGGASTAAAFLAHFAGDGTRWAHVDLAGPAQAKSPAAVGAPGATGYGVATTVAWLESVARRGSRSPARSR